MPYTGTVWKDGDLITAERMNNLERGVAEAATMGQVNTALEEALDNLPARGGGGLILADFHEMADINIPVQVLEGYE